VEEVVLEEALVIGEVDVVDLVGGVEEEDLVEIVISTRVLQTP
jgi:hypothetical protein